MTRYKPIPKTRDVDAEVALLQACNALDAAGLVAEQSQDVEGLLNVTAMWVKLSRDLYEFTLEGHVEDAKETFVRTETKIQTGFQVQEPDIAANEEEQNA